MSEQHEFLTVGEVAAEFRVSTMTVYRWLQDKDTTLHHIRVGRTIRISRESVENVKAGR